MLLPLIFKDLFYKIRIRQKNIVMMTKTQRTTDSFYPLTKYVSPTRHRHNSQKWNTHGVSALSSCLSTLWSKIYLSPLFIWYDPLERKSCSTFKTSPFTLQTLCQIKETREAQELKKKKKKHREFPANKGLLPAHAVPSAWLTTEYQMKCLWWAGPGHVSGGPAAAGALWFPDYKAGPARGPIWAGVTGATASH